MAYWASVVLRFCRSLLADAAAPPPPPEPKPATSTEGRSLRVRKPPGASTRGESVIVNGIGGC